MIDLIYNETVQVINWIKTQCEWSKKLVRMRVLILCPFGDWTTGTVVALNIGLVKPQDENNERSNFKSRFFKANNCRVFGVIYSSQRDGLLLKKCLDESDAIPWRAFSDYVTVSEKHAGIYLDALRKRGLQIKQQTACAVLYMPPGDAAIVQSPKYK